MDEFLQRNGPPFYCNYGNKQKRKSYVYKDYIQYILAFLKPYRTSCNPSISASHTDKSLHYRFQSDKDIPNNRQNAVYKVNYIDCHASYTEKSDKNLINKRMTEHKQATTVKSANTLVNIFNRRTMLPTWTLRKVGLQRYLVSTTDSRKWFTHLVQTQAWNIFPSKDASNYWYHANDLFSQFTKQMN